MDKGVEPEVGAQVVVAAEEAVWHRLRCAEQGGREAGMEIAFI